MKNRIISANQFFWKVNFIEPIKKHLVDHLVELAHTVPVCYFGCASCTINLEIKFDSF